MSILKFQMPEPGDSRLNKRIASTGGPGRNSKPTLYARGSTASVPITRNAQFAGSGASVTMTQPMFFSPLHTPQNWQIASKRREIYQWARFYYENEPKVAAGIDFYCFDPSTPVLMADGSQKSISSIKIGDLVRSHDGSSNQVAKVNVRDAYDEDMLKIKISGVSCGYDLSVTPGHEMLVIRDGKEKFIQAKDLNNNDYLLTPCKYEENDIAGKIDKRHEDFMWLLGLYSADGCQIPYKHISKKLKASDYGKGIYLTLSYNEKSVAEKAVSIAKSIYGCSYTIRQIKKKGVTVVSLYGRSIADDMSGLCPGSGRKGSKRFSPHIMKQGYPYLISLLNGFYAGDGCFTKNSGFQGVGVSSLMMEQVANMLDRCGIRYSFYCQNKVKGNRQPIYNVRISRSDAEKYFADNHKVYKTHTNEDFARNFSILQDGKYIKRKIRSIQKFTYSGLLYDLSVDNVHSYVVNRISCSNSNFPMNGFNLECPNTKILEFYEDVVENLELNKWLNYISHEYFLLGEVFPFLEIHCPECEMSGTDSDGEVCNHPGGTFTSIRVMNPDYIEVQDNVLAKEPVIAMTPDEELKMIIQRKEPRQIYDSLPEFLIELVSSGQPIPLSSRSISHIKFNSSSYATYGTSLLRRLFTVLAYKTKLMTANWIVAERLILPVRVVKIGENDRPASEEDIQDVVNQLAAVANDPNLTIVTHHAFDYEWYGSCYDDQTEVLTSNGWSLFKDTTVDNIFATYNNENGQLQYQQAEEYHEYDYDSMLYGPMYNFKARSVDINVTPNHRMLIERKGENIEVLSQDIKHDDKLLSQVEWVGRIPTNISYKDGPISHLSLDEYLEFVGYYITEGGSKEERYKGLCESKQIQACSISQSKISSGYDLIKASVGKTYPSYSTYEDTRGNGCDLFTINSVDIARYLSEEFGSHSWNKKIPRWILNLPKDKLKVIYDAMMSGDGSVSGSLNSLKYKYTTTSKELSDNWSEMLLKLGYWPSSIAEDNRDKYPNRKIIYRTFWSERRTNTKFNLRKQHILRPDYNGKVYCVKVPNSWLIVRRNGKVSICGNTGKIHTLNNEMEEIGKEILDGLMINQAILNGDAAGYNSAQVGVEIMIRRLENWRNRLKDWIEMKIFKPIAMMQGFVDEAKTKRRGKTVYIYPKVKFNDMNLRDNTNKVQTYLQIYDKQGMSMQTILEELDLDYDTEIERMRQENIIASQAGLMAPGGEGDMAGGMGGDMGGMGGDMGMDPMAGGMDPMAGGMPGADMAGGMGGEMGGGMPGGDMGAAAGGMPKITKRGKGGKEEEQQAPPPQIMKLTKLESTMFNELQSLKVPYDLFGQYQVKLPGEQQPFVLDFAYPQLGVAVETDGAIWHERPDLKQRDAERDQKLAQVGWKVMRFSEEAVYEHIDAVRDVVYQHIVEASKSKKGKNKKEANLNTDILKKYSSFDGSSLRGKVVQDIASNKDGEGKIVLTAGTIDDSFYLEYMNFLRG